MKLITMKFFVLVCDRHNSLSKINITISANPFLRPYKFVQICCVHYGGDRG